MADNDYPCFEWSTVGITDEQSLFPYPAGLICGLCGHGHLPFRNKVDGMRVALYAEHELKTMPIIIHFTT